MTTDVKIINGGLSKIAASRVSTISPPKTNLERFMADNYAQWLEEELSARRWRFALEYVKLTQTGDADTTLQKPYKFLIPNNALRPVREKGTEWEQRGRFLYSGSPALTALFVVQTSENDFDPLFVEVMKCKVALESAEYVTQSNSKKEFAERQYEKALRRAGQNNAYVTGSEAMTSDADNDTGFDWLSDRYGG
jgi:hypothetical protein